MRQTAASSESFDGFVLTELEIVRSSEKRLEWLFPKLRSNPQLQDSFLQQLAVVRKRAERLDAILESIRSDLSAGVELRPAASSVEASEGIHKIAASKGQKCA